MMAVTALPFEDAETVSRKQEAPHPVAAKALRRQVRGGISWKTGSGPLPFAPFDP